LLLALPGRLRLLSAAARSR